MQHQRSFAGTGVFRVPSRKAVPEKPVERRLRDKAPPAKPDDRRAIEHALLAGKFQRLEKEAFIFVMSVKNDDEPESHRNMPGNDVFQELRQNAAAYPNYPGDIVLLHRANRQD